MPRGQASAFVVDTNVPLVANKSHEGASAACVAACAAALRDITEGGGQVCVDSGRLIIREYSLKLQPNKQTGVGDKFLKWLLTNQSNAHRVVKVPLTPKTDDPSDFVEVPTPLPGIAYDPADRKFLAVAAAHPDRPPILQAADAKWWGWTDSLKRAGVTVRFLCPEFEAKYKAKMGV